MSNQANIRDIQILGDLKTAFGRFGEDVLQVLAALEKQFEEIQELLEERQEHWQRQVDEAENQVHAARRALRDCENSGSDDDEGDAPDCGWAEEGVSDAEKHLAGCEENLETVKQWRHRIESQIADFQGDIHRLANLASSRTSSVQSFLANKIEILDRYVGGTSTAVGSDLRGQNQNAKIDTGVVVAEKTASVKHHAWPKYLGGNRNQKLIDLPAALHYAYHGGLDKILPRQRGTIYYERLSGAARQQMYCDLVDYTKAFDAKYETKLYEAMTEENFPHHE